MPNYYNPVVVIQTEDWSLELNRNIEHLKISAPIIVTSPGNRKRLNLDSKFDPDSIFSDVGSNPTFDDCISAIEFCQKNMFDGVIGLGGGSAMDLAKVVMAHLSLEKTNINELMDYKGQFPRTIPSIFLPTTHGTASEVTMWGTLWNMEEEKKYSISHPELYPTVAILDGNLTLSLPLDISIITVMDALSHSLESIWNKNSNATSTSYAIKAISLILQNIETFKQNQNRVEIRNILLSASNKAGLAFSNTKTAAAHSISYPLTIHYGIPHGIASSISLIPLLDINRKCIKDSLKKLCEVNNMTYGQLKEKIISIPKDVIPFKLSSWNIPKVELKNLVKESFTKGRMDNNVVDLSIEDVNTILNMIY